MSKKKKRLTKKQRVHKPIGIMDVNRETGTVIESPAIPGVNSVADLLFGPEKK